MKLYCPPIIVLLLAATFLQAQPYDANKKYSVEALKADFSCLRDSLQKKHPNLYLYTPKRVFDAFFDSLYHTITAPQTDRQFYTQVTLLNGKIKNGHTMFLPGDSTTAYLRRGRYFPFYVTIAQGRMHVRLNCSQDTTIKAGAEILSINGTKTKYILNYLLERTVRDGYNTTYPIWILSHYFKEYYGFAFGHPDEFEVSFNNTAATKSETNIIKALPRDTINNYISARYAKMAAVGKGIALQINNKHNYALLTIKSFEDGKLQSTYNQNFKQAVDSAFEQIKSAKAKNLILDLRDNQGGDFENGQLLLAYLLGQPFNLLQTGQATETIQPLPNRFGGKLFVLINGGSFSNTAIVCSRLKFYKRGIFVGEETGGNNTIISGFANDETVLQLPNTKINCYIPNTGFTIKKNIADNRGHGTLPDYTVTPTVHDVITANDVVLKFAAGLAAKAESRLF